MTAVHKSDEISTIKIDNTQVPLCNQVKTALDQYFAQINGHKVVGLHAMVMSEVEKPLIISTLEHTRYNQSKASEILGMSRSTLRKKIELYNIS